MYHKDIKNEKTTEKTKPETVSDLGKSPPQMSKRLKIRNAACYPKIVKWMCKCILQGDIPMTKEQKKLLKPESEILRQIAEARVGQKLIRKQVRRHHKKGDSVLGKLLEVATSILGTMFYF